MAVGPSIFYGRGVPGEDELRLCPDVQGKRVLVLGGNGAVAFARLGAKAIEIDPDEQHIAAGRALAVQHGVTVEFHLGEVADLGFATSGSIDLVFSSTALGTVDDLPRVFRQVHRVLRPAAPLVFAIPHPVASMLEGGEVVLRRPYWSNSQRTIGGLFGSLSRNNFSVDMIVEPAPIDRPDALVPAALILRARKQGL
ncbi:MAG TPA: class I SAM-dependent methyltransferase [Acidimicrobiales bacterium]